MSEWPNNSEAGSAADDPHVAAVLGRFEAAWKAGENPRIEDFLADKSDGEQAVLFSRLLALEIDLRLSVGEAPVFAQLAKRFPAHIDAIRGVLEEAATIGSLRNGHAALQAPADCMAELPTAFGRYRVMGRIGAGGFGTVYSAFDDELQRMVAIKVPHAQWSQRPEFGDQYLAEARTLARLDHPHIVPAFDFGRTNDGRPFVVSKFIEGNNLSEVLNQGRPPFAIARSIAADIADALHYAHREGIVHRDVKPGNILVDAAGKAYLADFGMVLREEEFGTGPTFAGTPAYMSPEQARSEGHRVDGRSDVFSLGVVFYQMLTGRRPFGGATEDQLLAQLIEVEARPPRQIDDTIPRDLERICLKALSKRAADRYTTAKDMAEDLRLWSSAESSSPPPVAPVPTIETTSRCPTPAPPMSATSDREPIRIVPKGLRSFDAGDSDFFLELLPGPRDRDGLPNSLRFWKSRIEETDPDATFSVGLIYGPSGCGKSSLIKAGLLPRLSANVAPVYIEATAHDTEARLLAGLQRRFPDLRRDDWSLVESMSALRKGYALPRGQKALIVIDQFEQWLHAHGDDGQSALISALRQCDAARLQCIITVRDDFWLAVSRFLRDLEIRLVEGHNSALADLFDRDHARRVLAAFGRAFGKLPEHAADTRKDAREFLRQAVEGLSEEHKVNCARLALFAEMMKGKEWTPAALKAVGGTSGVGVTFLEETFSASTAPPAHRVHQKAARTVLHALLPESGSDIKGAMRSHDELLEASKYTDPRDFDELLRILDGELRLITPTDPQGCANLESSTSTAQPGDKYYQLTHDYLVPSLRDWLTRKQKESREGRAALALADRAAVWNARPENRQLPSLWQWLSFRRWTDQGAWTEPQRKMMRRAGRVHLGRLGVAAILLLACGFLGWQWYGRTRAEILHDRLVGANTVEAPSIIERAANYRRWFDDLCRKTLAEEGANDSKARLHASMGLLPVDPEQTASVHSWMLKCEPQDFRAIQESLRGHRDELVAPLWVVLENEKNTERARLRAACALAAFDPGSERWAKVNVAAAALLVAQDFTEIAIWAEALKPIGAGLALPLTNIMADERRSDAERKTATDVFALYARDFPRTWDEITRRVTAEPDSALSKEERDAAAKQRANLGVALLQLQEAVRAQTLLRNHEDPTPRTYLIHKVNPTRVRPRTLLNRLQDKGVPASVRQALILAGGEFPIEHMTQIDRDEFIALLEKCCRDDTDAGVRGAAEWLLREWGLLAKVDAIDARLQEMDKETASSSMPPADGRQWFVNSQKQVMVVVAPPGVFWMDEGDDRHQRSLKRSFAIASKETTLQLFQRFRNEHEYFKDWARTRDCPVLNVSWFEAAAFCNWLTKRDGMADEDLCYKIEERDGKIVEVQIAPDAVQRRGYRLPTDAEWEYACRAGAQTRYSFGDSEEMAKHYAWFALNAQSTTHAVGTLKPNRLGLFDMHGNAAEWCQGVFVAPPDNKGEVVEEPADTLIVTERVPRPLRDSNFATAFDRLGSSSVSWPDALGRIAAESGEMRSGRNRCGFRVGRTMTAPPKS